MEESQWYYIEQYYVARLNKEREQKERAQELVKELTIALNRKNTMLEISAITIKAALKRIIELEKV